MNLIQCIMTQSTCYKGTTYGVPVGILWHDTGAGNPNVKRYVQPSDNDPKRAELLKIIGKNTNGNDWNHKSVDAGVNAFIGRLEDGTVGTVQTLDWELRPWGCGSGVNGSCNGTRANNSPFWIQFEICDDYYKDPEYFKKAYREAVELTAFLCKKYNINPTGTVKYNGVTVPTILCHQDAYKLGLGSNHGDTLEWFKKMGSYYTFANVRKDVAKLMEEPEQDKGETIMDEKKVREIAAEVVREAIGKEIETITDIPWESVKKEMRLLLDMQAVDGGTPYEVNPDDIKLPLDIVRAIVIAKRFTVDFIREAIVEALTPKPEDNKGV